MTLNSLGGYYYPPQIWRCWARFPLIPIVIMHIFEKSQFPNTDYLLFLLIYSYWLLKWKPESETSLANYYSLFSADCEREFSQMILFYADGKNRLMVHNFSYVMMLGNNSPQPAYWNAEKYVTSWLQSGRHGAFDKATGLPQKQQTPEHRSKLCS